MGDVLQGIHIDISPPFLFGVVLPHLALIFEEWA